MSPSWIVCIFLSPRYFQITSICWHNIFVSSMKIMIFLIMSLYWENLYLFQAGRVYIFLYLFLYGGIYIHVIYLYMYIPYVFLYGIYLYVSAPRLKIETFQIIFLCSVIIFVPSINKYMSFFCDIFLICLLLLSHILVKSV